MDFIKYCAYVAVISCVIVTSHGHGRLVEPPSRASMWRFGFNTPHNYEDNQLFCGGFATQWDSNGGNCGVCGDNWADPEPRDHEGGAKYGTGTIVRTYTQGQTIGVTIQITASHLGWFEFRLCPHNDPSTPVTQACLDQHLLEFDDGTTRASGIDTPTDYTYSVRLPNDVTCSQCVLQWKYNTGNSWGTDPDTGASGLGYGPQEQFYGCADVTINPTDDSSSESTSSTSTTVSSTTTSTTTVITDTDPTSSTTASSTTSSTSTSTEVPTSPSTTPEVPTSTTSSDGSSTTCRSAGAYEGQAGMDQWCVTNCAAGNCPTSHCTCGDEDEDETEEVSIVCRSAGAHEGAPGMDAWCATNCAVEYCPATHCVCEEVTSRKKRQLSNDKFKNYLKKRLYKGALLREE